MSMTVVFTHWRRTENLKRILEQIKTQTLKPRIFVWNNGGDFSCPEADWQIDSSLNVITWPRWFMASMADTEYVCVADDDLMFKDARVLQDAIDFLKNKNERMIVGPYGVNLGDARADYKNSRHVSASAGSDIPVDMIKGRLSILRTAPLKSVNLVPDRKRQFLLSDDIIVCGLTARGKRRFHCVPSLFDGRVEELPAPFASSETPDHYDLREKTRREYFPGTAFDTGVASLSEAIERVASAWRR